MTPSGQTVCLAMIVKNEEAVLARCLNSLKDLIDSYVIIDTGSTDQTVKVAKTTLKGIPGTVIRRDWVDFATNRNEAMRIASKKADYVLVIDADDLLIASPYYAFPDLDRDAYSFKILDSSIVYERPQLFKSSAGVKYYGVLHEFASIENHHTTGTLPVVMKRGHDGARLNDSETYVNDAKVLEKALETEESPLLVSRYTFYLAQSYRDAGNLTDALINYDKRSNRGGWPEEIYVSLCEAGKILDSFYSDYDGAMRKFEKAFSINPNRCEARMYIAQLSRKLKCETYGAKIAKEGLQLPQPDGLFIEPWVYQYGLLDEYSVTAYYAGDYVGSLEACVKLLANSRLPNDMRARVASNAEFSIEKMKENLR